MLVLNDLTEAKTLACVDTGFVSRLLNGSLWLILRFASGETLFFMQLLSDFFNE